MSLFFNCRSTHVIGPHQHRVHRHLLKKYMKKSNFTSSWKVLAVMDCPLHYSAIPLNADNRNDCGKADQIKNGLMLGGVYNFNFRYSAIPSFVLFFKHFEKKNGLIYQRLLQRQDILNNLNQVIWLNYSLPA